MNELSGRSTIVHISFIVAAARESRNKAVHENKPYYGATTVHQQQLYSSRYIESKSRAHVLRFCLFAYIYMGRARESSFPEPSAAGERAAACAWENERLTNWRAAFSTADVKRFPIYSTLLARPNSCFRLLLRFALARRRELLKGQKKKKVDNNGSCALEITGGKYII